VTGSGRKFLIVNADDFGQSEGMNRGIIECHVNGPLTSTSLMVTGRAARQAVALGREHPELSIGLHWDVWGEDEREFDLHDHAAVRAEFARQLGLFRDLTGGDPTHVDSHRHAHREDEVAELFAELVAPLGVPLRGDGQVAYVGGFYAQWEWKVTNLEYVSVDFLRRMLREEVGEGWTELSCHPGYMTPDYSGVYASEREHEIATLTDPRIMQAIGELGIELRGYREFPSRSSP
jgi:predicted glycoside hydrolase/deacetylase ChbG (UPF0249 family)